MDSPDLHEVLFQWPHTEPYNVIVTGTFDNWSRSVLLSKTPTGFEATIKVPYGEKIKYKFIVDGQWVTHDDLPTEMDPGGFVNNVYIAPLKPTHSLPKTPPTTFPSNPTHEDTKTIADLDTSPKLEPLNSMQPVTTTNEAAGSTPPNGTESAAEKPNGNIKNGTVTSEQKTEVPAPATAFPQLISDIASTIVAADGTSSAFSYVTSGIGAAVHSVIGLDPVNAEQIGIPTPKTAKGFDVPSTEPETSAPESKLEPEQAPEPTPEHVSPAEETSPVAPAEPAPPTQEPVSPAETPSPVAPRVPITIVPVNAPENNTVASTPSPPPIEEVVAAASPSVFEPKLDVVPISEPEVPVTPEEPSTHMTVVPPTPEIAEPAVGVLRSTAADPNVDKPAVDESSANAAEVKEEKKDEPIELGADDSAKADAEETPKDSVSTETTVPIVVNAEETAEVKEEKEATTELATNGSAKAKAEETPKGTTEASTFAETTMPTVRKVEEKEEEPVEVATGGAKIAEEPPKATAETSTPAKTAEVKVEEKEKEQTPAHATNGSAKAEEAVEPPKAPAGTSVPPPISTEPPTEVSPSAAAATADPIPSKSSIPDPPATPTKKSSTSNGVPSPLPTPSSTKNGSATSSPSRRFFPRRSSSPSPSASSSKFGTTSSTRKKRQSIFGKMKNLFHHDKEKSSDK